MNQRPIFKLNKRLRLCAEFVQEGSRIADIGTDHAYLPIWLAKNDIIVSAIAADIKAGPLESAKSNIDKYRVSDKVKVRLSDGLCNIDENEVDEVIIAGMGGELIAKIISNAPWLKSKILILQPMSTAYELRKFLFNNGYSILKEVAVEDNKKIYSVMKVRYTTEQPYYDDVYPYIGLLLQDISNPDTVKYIEKEILHLKNQIKGLKSQNNLKEADKLLNIVYKLENYIKEDKND